MHIAPDQMPLRWPPGLDRTPPHERQRGWRHWGMHTQRQQYLDAIRDLGVQSGMLSLTGSQQDPGVCCYFDIYGNRCVIACDQFSTTGANLNQVVSYLRALANLRSIGDDAMLRKLIAGLRLSSHIPDWCAFFGFQEIPERSRLEKAHKRRAFEAHPDRGGTEEEMRLINEHMEHARAFYSETP